ncbi:MAG TPA: hypothetical protein VIH59_19150 [Candidatus Tectomicrobia bacterium]
MLKYAVDEDFNHEIIRGLALKDARLDFLTVQDVDLSEYEGMILRLPL